MNQFQRNKLLESLYHNDEFESLSSHKERYDYLLQALGLDFDQLLANSKKYLEEVKKVRKLEWESWIYTVWVRFYFLFYNENGTKACNI